MTRRKLDADARAARLEHRAAARAVVAAKVEAAREWRRGRIADAEAHRKAAAAARAADETSRGVDRVPERLRGLAVTVEPHQVGKHGTPIDSTPGEYVRGRRRLVGNHDERRSVGQRGKVRRPRRRELPGAVIRRLERAQKEWTS